MGPDHSLIAAKLGDIYSSLLQKGGAVAGVGSVTTLLVGVAYRMTVKSPEMSLRQTVSLHPWGKGTEWEDKEGEGVMVLD